MKRKLNPKMEDLIRRKVEAKYEERTGLVSHLVAFLIVNLMVWAIYLAGAASFPWPLFVTGGWGIGLISHVLGYYNEHGAGAAKREAAIAAEVDAAVSYWRKCVTKSTVTACMKRLMKTPSSTDWTIISRGICG